MRTILTRFSFLFSAVVVPALATAQCSDAGATPAPGPTAHPSGIISDDFNRCELAPFWTVIDPRGDVAIAPSGVGSGDAFLLLSLPAGVRHDPWPSNTAPRVMQPANDTDFGIAARFASTLDQSIEGHGLRVEDSAGNFLRFDLYRNGTQVRAFVGDDTSTIFGDVAVGPNTPAFLRVVRSGDSWTQSYSFDGSSWTDAVAFSYAFPAAVAAVGFHALNTTPSTPAYTAAVDWFANIDEPLTAEDESPTPDPETFHLSLEVITPGGDIDIQPKRLDFAPGEEVILTALALDGYEFVRWGGDVDSTDVTIFVIVDRDLHITAEFAPAPGPVFTVSTAVIDGEGTIEVSPAKDTYSAGETVTFTAIPADGFQFREWGGDASGTDATAELVIFADAHVTASFDPVPANPDDADGDGIPDEDDACPESDLSPTVVIDNCNTGVENRVLPNGCTLSDALAVYGENCRRHDIYFARTVLLLVHLYHRDLISRREAQAILLCAIRAKIPQPPCKCRGRRH